MLVLIIKVLRKKTKEKGCYLVFLYLMILLEKNGSTEAELRRHNDEHDI